MIDKITDELCFMCWSEHDDTKPCPPPKKAKEQKILVVFKANFPGTCDDCCDEINEGDKVTYNADNKLTHYVCP